MVQMDDTLSDIVRRALRNAAPRVMDRLEEEARDLHASAESQWPVKTGRSKAALDWAVRIPRPDQVEAVVFIDPRSPAADYAFFIKGKKQGGASTWHALVRRPGRRRAKRLAEDLAKDLIDLAGGR